MLKFPNLAVALLLALPAVLLGQTALPHIDRNTRGDLASLRLDFGYTVATLPNVATYSGRVIVVEDSDGADCEIAAVPGEPLLCRSDGTNWLPLASPGASDFASITAGTSTAALVIGTGGSLSVSGSGTIAATTAAAAASNPANCSAGQLPRGVATSFAAEGCAAVDLASEVTGALPAASIDDGAAAATQALFSGAAGSAGFRAIADADVPNSITIDLAASATNLAGAADAQIYIGTGAGAGSFAALSGDATMTNGGVVTVADDSHAHTSSSVSGLDAANDISSGLLALARGGAGADLSATGGANQFVRQSSVGGALSVSAIADADVPNTITIDLATAASALANNPAALINTFCLDRAADGSCAGQGDLDDLGGTVDATQVDLTDDYAWTGGHSFGAASATPLVFEGATADAFETTLTVTDPTADHTFTLPNADSVAVVGTVCSAGDFIEGIDASTGVIICGAPVPSSTFDPQTWHLTNVFLKDDFPCHNSTDHDVGELGWANIGSHATGISGCTTSTQDRGWESIVPATGNTFFGLAMSRAGGTTTTFMNGLSSQDFELTWIFRLRDVGEVFFKVGLGDEQAADAVPVRHDEDQKFIGAMFKNETTDSADECNGLSTAAGGWTDNGANFQFMSREAANTSGLQDSALAVVVNTWYRVRIRNTATPGIEVCIVADAASPTYTACYEETTSANFPTAVTPFIGIMSCDNSTTGGTNNLLDIDFMQIYHERYP